MLLTSTSSALAHEPASPSPTLAPLSELDQYKHDLDHYRIDMNLREQTRKEIAKVFVAAIKTAESIAKSSLRTAKGDKAKSIILEQQESAKADAMRLRDEAIEAMGPAPIEPTRPTKLAATAKKTKPIKPSATPSP